MKTRNSASALSNIELEQWAQTLGLRRFLGVFPDNKLPRLAMFIRREWTLICNLSTINQKGTHWIALSRKQEKLKIFDSLALDRVCDWTGYGCNVEDIINRLMYKRQILRIIYEPRYPIQSLFSVLCGYFVLQFIYIEEKGESGLDLLPFTQVPSKLMNNDIIVMKNFLKISVHTIYEKMK